MNADAMCALYSEIEWIMQSETLFLPRKLYCMELQLAKKRWPTPLWVAAHIFYFSPMITLKWVYLCFFYI